jgi:hypothetical protein
MEVLDHHNRIELKCPSCNAEYEPKDIRCKYCGSIITNRDLIEKRNAEQVRGLYVLAIEQKVKYVRYAVYVTSALNFVLGLLEGFWQNNSIAMAVNFCISLVFLMVSARSSFNPLAVIFFCVIINVINHGLCHQLKLCSILDWFLLKSLLFLIPFISLRYALPASKMMRESRKVY